MDRSDVVDDILAHHGIKGQKWGVRRVNPSGVTRLKRGASEPSHSDANKANSDNAKAKGHGTATLSTAELRSVVNRIQLEQQYSSLSPSKLKKGHSAVKGLLAAGATVNAVIVFAKSPAGQAIAKQLKK